METISLILSTFALSFLIGVFSAITAWRSGNQFAAFAPLSILAVPPWLFGYYFSDLFHIYGFAGATISLGVCCSVYVHSILVTRLYEHAESTYEVYSTFRGRTWRTLALSCWPSIRSAALPSLALVAAEVTTDFGTVNYFGVDTFTMLAYNEWTSQWSISTPSILTLLAMAYNCTLISTTTDIRLGAGTTRRSSGAWAAVLPYAAVIGLSIACSIWYYGTELDLVPALHSAAIVLAVLTLCSVVVALDIAKRSRTLYSSAVFLYAVPGVLIGFVLSLSGLSLWLALPLGLALRYAVLMLAPIMTNTDVLDDVILCYVQSKVRATVLRFRAMALPVTIGALMTALDVMRELPITMMLHPPELQPLSLRISSIARTEQLDGIGSYSLVLISINFLLISIVTYLRTKRNV